MPAEEFQFLILKRISRLKKSLKFSDRPLRQSSNVGEICLKW